MTGHQLVEVAVEKGLPCLDVNSVVLLDILREVVWNWSAFVV